MINAYEAAELWGISKRRVTTLCKENRIPGAVKEKQWLIPAATEKPRDARYSESAFRGDETYTHLPMPVGVSDYCLASSKYYYVDKTLFIKEIIDRQIQVALFTRPRRFGKSLNMDMLCAFFERTEEDRSVYFRDKKIWSCGEKYREQQGKYPVIFLSFKDVKCDEWNRTLEALSLLLQDEFLRHGELRDSERLDEVQRKFYARVVERQASQTELENSLKQLSKMLALHHGVKPIVIIDEYDTPIQEGYFHSFYKQIVGFMRNLFSGALKDNKYLSFGVLTGILRVAKESIFSGLNNVTVYTILDNSFSQYFGFTEQEVKQLLADYNLDQAYPELCKWYDGYRFGDTEIFNPWSIINCIANNCLCEPYWRSTSSNDIIAELINMADEDTVENLHKLLNGGMVQVGIETGVIYPDIKKNPDYIYSFLLVCGYLKPVGSIIKLDYQQLAQLAIPNREIRGAYSVEIINKLQSFIAPSTANNVQLALVEGNQVKLRKALETLLKRTVSYYDTYSEVFYHGLVLGLCAILDNRYMVYSNREAGDGRYDICLLPKEKELPGILIELKAGRAGVNLQQLAKEAMQQIGNKYYATQLEEMQLSTIYKYGIAFSGKQVELLVEG